MFTKADIERYFIAEKSASLLYIIIGAAAIILAVLFYFYLKTSWHKGAAVPLLMIGIVHLVASIIVYRKCDDDRKRNAYAYDMNIGELKNKELPRMEKVNRNFTVLRYIEIALMIAGLVLFYSFNTNYSRQFWAGFGIALVIEAAMTFGAGYTAQLRAKEYTKGLSDYVMKQP